MTDQRLFHIALASEWEAAKSTGFYERSTLGASVVEEGYIHCSRGMAQVDTAYADHYASVDEPLVLLHINEDELPAADLRVVDEAFDPEDPDCERFPHLYGGPLPTAAVQEVVTLQR